jgi:hypothetical protein
MAPINAHHDVADSLENTFLAKKMWIGRDGPME